MAKRSREPTGDHLGGRLCTNLVDNVVQIRLVNKRVKNIPAEPALEDVEWAVSFGTGNAKEKHVYSKDWEDLQPIVRKVYNAVDRSKIPNPMYAPKKMGGKADLQEFKIWCLRQYASGQTPPDWLHTGKGWGTILFPTHAMIRPNVDAMLGKQSALCLCTIVSVSCSNMQHA